MHRPLPAQQRPAANIYKAKLKGGAGSFFSLKSLEMLWSFSFFHIFQNYKRAYALNGIHINVKFESNSSKKNQ